MRGTNNSNVLLPTFGCEGTNLMNRDMKEQKHMIGRNKNKNMLEQKVKEQKLKEQKNMIGRNKNKTCWNKHLGDKNT
jgi:hypothetical protein